MGAWGRLLVMCMGGVVVLCVMAVQPRCGGYWPYDGRDSGLALEETGV